MIRILFYALMTACLLNFQAYAENCNVYPFFSPKTAISNVIVYQIWKTRKSVLLSINGLHSPIIAHELIQLKKMGVDVQVKVEKAYANTRSSQVKTLQKNGVPVLITELDNHLFIIGDAGTPAAHVLLGNWDFTKNPDSEGNSIVLMSDCPKVIQAFQDDFNFSGKGVAK